jgi:ankyrin repeat protein
LLLDAGADINARDSDHGFTALTWAGVGGHADLVKVLLERGADPGVKGNEDKTVLRLAAEKGLKDVVEVLKGHGVRK